MELMIVISVLLFVFAVLLAGNIRVVPQSETYVIERLGAYYTTWQVGLHMKNPLIDRIRAKISLKEQVLDFPPQPVITKDNVAIKIDSIIFFQITDSKAFTYGVTYPIAAIEKLTSTSLRNIIGQLELDETLSSREHINTQMRSTLDEATDPWGIRVNRVEVKNILPPADIQEAMEKQMRAERERRCSILEAEGFKTSAILKAEGDKAAAILQAEAVRESAIRRAEGEAQAILTVQDATAKGLVMLKNAQVDQAVLTLKSFETLAKVADGQSTKLIIPSDLQNVAALVASVTEIAQHTTAKDNSAKSKTN